MDEMNGAITFGSNVISDEIYADRLIQFSFEDAVTLLEKNQVSNKIPLTEAKRIYDSMLDAYKIGIARGFNLGAEFQEEESKQVDTIVVD